MDFSNSLYYTFSTIAQVLSGFIALSGVFVIFKVQELKKMQFLQVQHFYNYLNGVSGLFVGSFHDCPTIAVTLKTLHKSECIGGMNDEMNKIIENENVAKSAELKSLIRMREVFKNIDAVRLGILFWTKISMISCLVTILFSVAILISIPHFSNLPTVRTNVYWFGAVGLLISVGTMIWVLFSCLKERNYLVVDKK